MSGGKIVKVSGPLVIASDLADVKMYDVVKVGLPQLIGEVIGLDGNTAFIQVYEETAGIGPDEPVSGTGEPLSVELGPGLIGGIYDGIQRPLTVIQQMSGNWIARGIDIPKLDRKKKWTFKAKVSKGEQVITGDIIGTVQETELVEQKIMVPPGLAGEVTMIKSGDFTVEEVVCQLKQDGQSVDIKMAQHWPVRRMRPVKDKLPPSEPLVTGQRVIDTFFPVAKGGTACIPGPFGSGKTVVQHQLAKWADAQIIVYVGCGERGNEMTDVLMEFPKLKDPRSGEPLIKRTVLIANTSNMPVSAREASVYTGITIAEYFRDMGYTVALMADSTSRWAEALREMSGRLEEMPGEEGYPAYLSMRLAEFYERAGKVKCACSEEREGSLSVVGAVSPPGGDLSDPVVQSTLRVVKVFWSLEDKLAYMRHFPAINWLNSYSLYLDNISDYVGNKISPDFLVLRRKAIKLLQDEASLEEIVRLVGVESLSANDRLTLATAKSLREDFLHQMAFDPEDTYTSLQKQYQLLQLIMHFHHLAKEAISRKQNLDDILKYKIREKIAKAKYIPEDKIATFKELFNEVEQVFKGE
ncbi:MAG: V-type ATP synthase subunit A [bacterium]|nr:V-type ATP synthase subunit A [bacterium]